MLPMMCIQLACMNMEVSSVIHGGRATMRMGMADQHPDKSVAVVSS